MPTEGCGTESCREQNGSKYDVCPRKVANVINSMGRNFRLRNVNPLLSDLGI